MDIGSFSLRKHGSRSAFQHSMVVNWNEPYWAQIALNVETNSPELPKIGLNVRRGSQFRLFVQTFGAQKSESGRSVFTIIDSLQSPLERFSRQSVGMLPTIRGKCACLRAKMVRVSRHLPGRNGGQWWPGDDGVKVGKEHDYIQTPPAPQEIPK